MKSKKVKVAIDLSTTGKGGGPFTSSTRIMNSSLKDKYEYSVLSYDTSIGRGISVKRIKNLVAQLKEINPDIVHFTGLQLSGFHVAVACWVAGVRNTVVTVRGFSGDAAYFHPVKKFIVSFILEPITLFIAKRVYGVSDYVVSRKVIQFFKRKVYGSIYNFAPIHKKGESKISLREELRIQNEDILVVTVARIIRDKGYHILDQAILKCKKHKNLKFLIVGRGDYLEEMKSNLNEQVKDGQVFFLGYREDVQHILSACQIFVLPTLHETLSVALLEASMESLALVASDTGGVPEIVETGFNGILVPPGNVDSLEEAISKLYKDGELRSKYGGNARKKIDIKFSEESIVNQIDEVYQSVLKG